MKDGGGLNIECEPCEIPAEYEDEDFFYTHGTDDNDEFSSCIINLCSDYSDSCPDGEVLMVCLMIS